MPILRSIITRVSLAAVVVSLFAAIGSAHAQGTAFTYQGFLTDLGAPANAAYDLRFTVYDTDGLTSVGSVVGGPVTTNDVVVVNGLFTVTLDFGAAPFDGSARWLEMGARPGASTGGYRSVTPRSPITATPYAIRAANFSGPVAASQITGTLAAGNIGAGTISSSKLAPGAAAANLNAGNQSGVASGGLVLSAKENTALLNAGYVRIGTTTTGDAWQQRVNGTPPSARNYHTAVWTGCEMIVWGGGNGTALNDGGRYNPAGNSWTAVSTAGGPAARYLHTAVWTGSEMLVWGGIGDSGVLNDGGRYDPVGNSWTLILNSLVNTPAVRYGHTAVWAGSEMLVWGGFNGTYFNDGGRYNPAGSGSWTAIPNSLLNTPVARSAHTAVWTGSEMIVWGGSSGGGLLNDGGRYNPAGAGGWAAIPNTLVNTPAARNQHTALWTGSEMIVWGGDGGGFIGLNTGGRYNPAGNGSWTTVSPTGAPAARREHRAVWTGSEMIVWGGYGNTASPYLSDGGRYNPAGSGSWTAVNTAGAPGGRYAHTAVWTGSEMIVWGGENGSRLNDGGRFNLLANRWTAMATTGAPGVRIRHTAVWTGSEMIIWGGYSELGYPLNDRGRYNPAADSWMAMATTGAPTARRNHTAVWTGTEMIVWGGGVNSGTFNDGGRYNPAGNSWTLILNSLVNTPVAREEHTAVWTGTEMIVWGGGVNRSTFNDGGRYNPAGSGSWTAIPNTLLSTPTERVLYTVVWTGSEMIVWGGHLNGIELNDGGRYNPAGAGSWAAIPNTLLNTPAARHFHTAVWTGSEMIVWGGSAAFFGSQLNDGGRYNPAGSGSWTAIPNSLLNTPAARSAHTAVWTGSEMIVWGGSSGGGALNDGGRYNPAGNSWTTVSADGAPSGRFAHTAVWTESEMIVWGGTEEQSRFNDGGRYNPAANSWTAVSTSGAPAARVQHTAVWTGSEMIVWGGGEEDSDTPYNTGGRYNPAGNSWMAVSTSGAPAARVKHTAVWSGTEMIVWGGEGHGSGSIYNDGGRYNPVDNSWTLILNSLVNTPAARELHTTVWTGSEMIVWGGSSLNDGGRYNPAGAGSWTAIPNTLANTPAGRDHHTAVWTGSEMIVWGGSSLNDGGRYNPAGAGSWTAIPNTLANTPAGRDRHTAVWTGSEMIVWGGRDMSDAFLNTGGRYNPAGAGSWTAIPNTLANTPAGRYSHTAVWTGSEMIVWGGDNATSLNTGGRYNPACNGWTPVSTTWAPAARSSHTSVWTGSEMIVWGGDVSGRGFNDNDPFSYTPGRVMYLYQRP